MASLDELLVAHVLGELSRPEQEALEAQLQTDPQARSLFHKLQEAHRLVGSLLSTEAPLPSVREQLLEDASASPSFQGYARRLEKFFDLQAEPIQVLLAQAKQAASWEPFMPGVSLLHLKGGPKVAEADTGLVRFAAGLNFPRHRHLGDEYMFVLSGTLQDQAGKLARAGDIEFSPKDSVHSFRVLEGEECVSAVILFGGLEIG